MLNTHACILTHIPHANARQSYKSKRMPNRFLAWSSTWRSNHPGWEWKLWLDRDNRKLVADDFPW